MRGMKALALACALAVMPAMAVSAKEAAKKADVDAARLETAKKLIRVTTSDRMFDQIMRMAAAQVTAVLVRMKPDRKQEIVGIMQRLAREMTSKVNRKALIDKIAAIYAREFTTDEMNKVIAFYETPVGRKFVDKMPKIMLESQRVGMEWGRDIAREFFRRAREEAKKKGIDL